MEMEMKEEVSVVELNASVERLTAAAEMLEQVVERLSAAEAKIAELQTELQARAEVSHAGRKTMPGSTASLLAKHDGEAVETGALDAALTGLSLEQRIAVKAQLMRAGLVG